MTDALAFVREVSEPQDPPPSLAGGAAAWAKANLFSSIGSSLTTFVFVALALWLLPPLISWATTKAVWAAPDGALCRQHQDGACWAFIRAKFTQLVYGFYPDEHLRLRRPDGEVVDAVASEEVGQPVKAERLAARRVPLGYPVGVQEHGVVRLKVAGAHRRGAGPEPERHRRFAL